MIAIFIGPAAHWVGRSELCAREAIACSEQGREANRRIEFTLLTTDATEDESSLEDHARSAQEDAASAASDEETAAEDAPAASAEDGSGDATEEGSGDD